jgi:hypothetical protein
MTYGIDVHIVFWRDQEIDGCGNDANGVSDVPGVGDRAKRILQARADATAGRR